MTPGKVVLLSIVVSVLTSAATVAVLSRLDGPEPAETGPEAPDQDEVEVPPLRGMHPDQARLLLEAVGLMLVLDGKAESAEVDEGLILSQSPLPGSSARAGWPIKVVIAAAVEEVEVPVLVGTSLVDAQALLEQRGLKATVSGHEESADVPADQVMMATPPAGATLAPGAAVRLVVSAGPPGVEVPRVVRAKINHAKGILRRAGFAVGEVKYHSHPEAISSTVLSQSPEAGSTAPPGSAVDLVVNTAE